MLFHKKAHKRNLALLAAIGVLIAGGAAYTTSNTNTAIIDGYQVAGYAPVTVSGAALVSFHYTLDGNDPPSVVTVDLVTAGDTHNAVAYVGFNGTGHVGAACAGVFASGNTTYTNCGLPGGTAELVSAITSTDVAVAP